MKVLLTGATGQVGYEILRSKPKCMVEVNQNF